jgi:hypothetical protein
MGLILIFQEVLECLVKLQMTRRKRTTRKKMKKMTRASWGRLTERTGSFRYG